MDYPVTQHTATTPTVSTTKDTRLQNFIGAYKRIGYDLNAARSLAQQRLAQDDDAVFHVPGCTDYKSVRETVWLLEAAELLCGGDLYRDDAVELIELALAGVKALAPTPFAHKAS